MKNLLFLLLLGVLLGLGLLYASKSSDETLIDNQQISTTPNSEKTKQQTIDVNKFVGEWNLDDVLLKTKREEDGTPLTKENFIWRDLYKDKSPLTLTKDYGLFFMKDGKIENATFKVSDTEFIIEYSSGDGKKSYTLYNYKLRENSLILEREDPLVIEKYTFSGI